MRNPLLLDQEALLISNLIRKRTFLHATQNFGKKRHAAQRSRPRFAHPLEIGVGVLLAMRCNAICVITHHIHPSTIAITGEELNYLGITGVT
jgi:hypothetical protein